MFLLVLVLNKTEYLNKILEGFLKIGIHGATIIDSTGMGRALASKVPVFGGIRCLFEDCRLHNKTIFSVVEDEAKFDKAVKTIESIIGGLGRPGTGIVFSVPLQHVKGLARNVSLPNHK